MGKLSSNMILETNHKPLMRRSVLLMTCMKEYLQVCCACGFQALIDEGPWVGDDFGKQARNLAQDFIK